MFNPLKKKKMNTLVRSSDEEWKETKKCFTKEIKATTTCYREGKPTKMYKITDVKLDRCESIIELKYTYGGIKHQIRGNLKQKDGYIYHYHITKTGKQINFKIKTPW